MACGLLLKALENGYRCQFVKAQDLFDEMYASLADRSTRQLLKRLARLDVLLIDELGYLNLKPEQSNIFFKLMEERYRQHSTIITTNLVYDEWPNFLGSRPMVEALLSRLRHYRNLHKTEDRLRRLMRDFKFSTVSKLLQTSYAADGAGLPMSAEPRAAGAVTRRVTWV